MFNWNDIRVLLEVVRAGSISGAAATLKVDASTVSRRIQALEKELGTRCFERTSGRLHLRAECAAILTQAQLMESAAAEIERAMHPEFSPAAGVVRVATTRTMASKVVLPAIDAIAQSDPHVTVEVDTQVQRINLIRGEAEIALTPYAVTHPRLIRRLVFEASGALYGSREYFDGRRPPTPGSFDGHRLLGMAEVNAATPAGAWWDENIHGGEVVLRSSSAEELLRLCCEGRGLALLFCFRADGHELVRVPSIPTTKLPHYLVVHPDQQHMPRVRAVIEAIEAQVAACREELEGMLPSRWLELVPDAPPSEAKGVP